MQAILSHTEIIDILKADKAFLKKEFGVINIGLFGSYAKDNQKTDSDIDILVELEEPRFEWFAGLQIYLVPIHKWPFLSCSAFSAGFRLRRTDVRLTANLCAALIRTKIAHF